MPDAHPRLQDPAKSGWPGLTRATNWAVRRNGVSMGLGVVLILLGSAILILGQETYLLVAAVVLVPAPLLLALAVYGRSRIRWLPLTTFAVTFWCAIFAGLGVQQALLQLAGHDELCRYVSSSGYTDSNGTTTTDWVVKCPDGTQTFSADDGAVQIDAAGFIHVRTVAGGLLGAAPSSARGDYALWYLALPGIGGTVAVLVTAVVTPRRRENSLTGTIAQPA